MKKIQNTVLGIIVSAITLSLPNDLFGDESKAAPAAESSSEKLFNNPIIFGRGVCDPHIHIFEDKAYLYASHDDSRGNDFYTMYNWWVWSSSDLVHWDLEFTLQPRDMYVGITKNSWAVDAAERNGKYYFYVSANWHTAVAVSTNGPAGPYKDALGEALYTDYDPTIFIDDDESRTPYLVVSGYPYKIARMNEDMVSLAEEPRPIVHATKGWEGDGGFLHKRNGIYYLNGHGTDYSTSTNVYGPYTYRGTFFPRWIDHPTIFNWNNQTYCAYGVGDGDQFFRTTHMTYVHYKENGDIVADPEVANSFVGVGQYDCSNPIQAEWYFSATDGTVKKEGGTGFVVANIKEGSVLYYPRVLNVAADAAISIDLSSEQGGGTIEIREGTPSGTLLGSISVPATGTLADYESVSTTLDCSAGMKDIYLVFKGSGHNANLDQFTIASSGALAAPPKYVPDLTPQTPSSTAEPVDAFSRIEAENCLTFVGLHAEPCSDEGGGKNLAFIRNKSNCAFKLDFGSETEQPISFQARASAANPSGGRIELRLDKADGPLIGTCVVTGTGGWQSWKTFECDVSNVSGVHDLFLIFKGEGDGYLFNLNWVKFAKK